MVAESRTGAQHRGQPGAQPRVVAQRSAQVGAKGHPGQRGQGQIRVGGGGERLHQVRIGALGLEREILGHQQLRTPGIGETHPGQATRRGGPAQHAHPSTVAGTGASAQMERYPWRRPISPGARTV